jgi:hypothetical protein
METQLAEHKIEPNSGLGKAIEFGSKARPSSLRELAENSRYIETIRWRPV